VQLLPGSGAPPSWTRPEKGWLATLQAVLPPPEAPIRHPQESAKALVRPAHLSFQLGQGSHYHGGYLRRFFLSGCANTCRIRSVCCRDVELACSAWVWRWRASLLRTPGGTKIFFGGDTSISKDHQLFGEPVPARHRDPWGRRRQRARAVLHRTLSRRGGTCREVARCEAGLPDATTVQRGRGVSRNSSGRRLRRRRAAPAGRELSIRS